MDFNLVEMKCEAGNQLLQCCNACFSVDRKILAVGKLIDVFKTFFENSGMNLVHNQVLLCWECLAFLKRINTFKKNVLTVQTFMYNHYYCNQNGPLPTSLSKLVTTYNLNVEYEVKQETEIVPEEESQESYIKREEPGPSLTLLDEVDDNMKQEVQDNNICTNYENDDWQNDNPTITDEEYSPRKKCKSKKRTKPRSDKYILQKESSLSIQKFYTKQPTKLNDTELSKLMEQDRKDKLFMELPYRCDKCVCGWNDKYLLRLHNKTRHNKSAGDFECPICSSRIATNNAFQVHLKSHYVERRCNKCKYRTATQGNIRRHILKHHIQTVECRSCGITFRTTREFSQHYKSLHLQYICDNCGRVCHSRQAIKKHLRQHGPFMCCKRVFSSQQPYRRHRARHHYRGPPELAYCVECDRQFRSVHDLRVHLTTAVMHGNKGKRKKVACPDCGKIYARRTYMLYHYNFVHLKQSKYKCEECGTSFLNRTHYKAHMRKKHEPGWEPPRNKICPMCGRGFTQNTILQKHIRTHTGERPYACTFCDAKFTQNCALTSHVKHIHLKEKRQPTAQARAARL